MTDNIDDEFRQIVAQLTDLDEESLDDFDEDSLDDLDAELPPAVQPAPPPKVSYELTTPRSWSPGPEVDDFVPPPPLPPATSPSAVAWSGIASIAAGTVLLGGVILGWLAGSWATPLGFIVLCGGILVLFTRLPKDRDDGPDNGAKV
jgi:hypothetical protein